MRKVYESYKDSVIEWIGEIPEDWEIVKLKYFTDIYSGYAFKSNDYVEKKGFPIIRIGDINDDIDISKTKKVKIENINQFEKYLIQKDDILIAMTGATIGKIAVYNNSDIAFLNQRVGAFRVKSPNNQKFLKYFLSTDFFNEFIQLECEGSAQENIGVTEINNFFICLPNSITQSQIASYLDYHTAKIDTLIEKKQQLIEKLEAYRQSVINDAVTGKKVLENGKWVSPKKTKNSGIEWIGEIPDNWRIERVYGLCEIVRGNSSFKKDELLTNGKYVALQYGKTYKVDTIDENYNFYVNEEFFKDTQTVNYGDVIIISTSETLEDLGHSVFYNRNDVGLLGGEQIVLKPIINKIKPKFLYYSTRVFFNELRKNATGVKVLRFNTNDLKKIQTLIPSIYEQEIIVQQIESKISKTEKIIISTQASIQKLQDYRQSLISEVVTGKIDVRDWQEPKKH